MISNANSLGIIQVSGPDAMTFLQGQITQDTTQLGHSLTLSAICDRKGKVISTFLIARADDSFWFILSRDLIEVTLETLKPYSLFSKVEMKNRIDLCAHDKPNSSLDVQLQLPKDIGHVYFSQSHSDSEAILQPNWLVKLTQMGYPLINLEASKSYTAHQLNLDKHNGISFEKGCYIGQEIIARTQYKGVVKRRVHYKAFHHSISVGEKIELNGSTIATVVVMQADKDCYHCLCLVSNDDIPKLDAMDSPA